MDLTPLFSDKSNMKVAKQNNIMKIMFNAFIKSFYMGKPFKKIDCLAYQKYIDTYITKHSKNPLIFVGLNIDIIEEDTKLYYNLHADYKYFITIFTS